MQTNPISNTSTRHRAIENFGPILIKKGYHWVDLDDFAAVAALNPDELRSEFPNKTLLCEAWMEETENRSRRHHDTLLKSGDSVRDLIENYFDELETFMQHHEFGGCPFTNTAQALRNHSEPRIERRIKEHKNELRRFFSRLCERDSLQPGMLSEALFLIYSGATTEASNIKSMEPVVAGRHAALALYDLHAAA